MSASSGNLQNDSQAEEDKEKAFQEAEARYWEREEIDGQIAQLSAQIDKAEESGDDELVNKLIEQERLLVLKRNAIY